MNTIVVLIAITFGHVTPTYTMQEFATADACKAARSFMYKHGLPPGDMTTNFMCVSQATGLEIDEH